MNRDEFLRDLRIADDVGGDEPLTSYAQRLADYDADRRVLIRENNVAFDQLNTVITQQMEEIEQLKTKLATAKGEVWSQIVREIDYRHCTVTMDQIPLKEWCMAKYKENQGCQNLCCQEAAKVKGGE
jgi:hypothetical protein